MCPLPVLCKHWTVEGAAENLKPSAILLPISVADPDPFDTDPDPAFNCDTNPDPAFQFGTDLDPAPTV